MEAGDGQDEGARTCEAFYEPDFSFIWEHDEQPLKNDKKYPNTLPCPTHQQVIDWLMDEHLFFVSVNCTEWMHTFVGNVQTENGSVSIAPCHDYYEALNGAIELALNSIENE